MIKEKKHPRLLTDLQSAKDAGSFSYCGSLSLLLLLVCVQSRTSYVLIVVVKS